MHVILKALGLVLGLGPRSVVSIRLVVPSLRKYFWVTCLVPSLDTTEVTTVIYHTLMVSNSLSKRDVCIISICMECQFICLYLSSAGMDKGLGEYSLIMSIVSLVLPLSSLVPIME